MRGTASDISIQAEEIIKMKKNLNIILAKHCNQPIEQIEKDTDRDCYMSAEEAKNYKLIDTIHIKKG
jgi:ATP-dependent Clp protease, protease subunit